MAALAVMLRSDVVMASVAGGAALLTLLGFFFSGGGNKKKKPAKKGARRSLSDQFEPEKVNEENQKLKEELDSQRNLKRELIEAKQAAEAAMMSKGEFLATMSHEIRTPLNGIIPLLDVLMGTSLAPTQFEYVQTAFSSSKQLLRIVDDILDYSKLEANKVELEVVSFNLRELVDSVVLLMRRLAEKKGLKIDVEIDPAIRISMRSDPVRLRQVLTNLMSNAIKFTNRGKVSLVIKRTGESHMHQHLRFEVVDTGIGIDAEAAKKLFQAFNQADTSTTRTFGGTGLGLAICKTIVELFGGEIAVDSSVGQGSTFWFEIPTLKAPGDIPTIEIDLSKSRLMLLSTDTQLTNMINRAAASWGSKLTVAPTFQEFKFHLHKKAGSTDATIALIDTTTVGTDAIRKQISRELQWQTMPQVYFYDGDDEIPGLNSLPNTRYLPIRSGEPDLKLELDQLLAHQMAELMKAKSTAEDIMTDFAALVRQDKERQGLLEEKKEDAATQTSSKPTNLAESLSVVKDDKLAGSALLVEDNEVNRAVAKRLVGLTGLTIDVAEDGQQAFDKMLEKDYDIILMDCQMPVLDGYSATRKRRAYEKEHGLPRLPIVAMTANAMLGDREKCLDAGMDDYLSKPLNKTLLKQTLGRWVSGRSSTGSTAERLVNEAIRQSAPEKNTSAVEKRGQIERPFVSHDEDIKKAMGEEIESLDDVFSNVARPVGFDDEDVLVDASEQQPPAAISVSSAALSPEVNAPAEEPESTNEVVAFDLGQQSGHGQHDAMVVKQAVSLDFSIIDELREVMGEDFGMVVKSFLRTAPDLLNQLKDAAMSKNMEGLVAPAHTLKSSSANVGALKLSELAKFIEQQARLNDLSNPVDPVKQMFAEFRKVGGQYLEMVKEAA